MIAIRHCHRFVQSSRYDDQPLVRFQLELPVQGLSEEEYNRIRAALGSIGVALADLDLALPDESRLETRLFASLVLALLQGSGHAGVSAVVESEPAAVRVRAEELISIERAGELALDLLNAAVSDHDLDRFQAVLARLRAALAGRIIDPNALLIARLARQRGLPVMWLDQQPFEEVLPGRDQQSGLYKLGHGRSGRVMAGAMPRPDDPISLERLVDRGRLLAHLSAAGFNVPIFDPGSARVHSGSRAARSAARIGFPVRLCQPERRQFAYRQSARADFGPLHDAEQLRQAFDLVAGPSGQAWLERAVSGVRYRCLVIGGQVRAVAACRPPEIVGDGRSTIEQLIRAKEQSGSAAGLALSLHDSDVALRLRLAGAGPEQVPEAGWRLALRAEGSLYNGGRWEDVSDQAAPSIRDLAAAAARHCNLPQVAGVDLVLLDPARPADASNLVVIDVVPDPDLLGHANSAAGTRGLDHLLADARLREIGSALLDSLFADGQGDGRIPLVAVTGTNGKTTTTRMIEGILRQTFESVACTSTEFAVIGDRVIHDGDSAGVHAAMLLLAEDDPDAAVLETARGGLINRGIAFARCDVGVCLNIQADHLGVDGVETLDELAAVKSEVVRRADRAAVLNADDERVVAMAASVSAAEIILVSRHPDSSVLRAHLARGGRGVSVQSLEGRKWICEFRDDEVRAVVAVDEIPATFDGAVDFNLSNACFAVAAALGLGLAFEPIAKGLRAFNASHDCNPGRFNVFDGLHCRVLIDHAQNEPAIAQLGQAAAAMPCSGRRWILLRALGNRSDAEIQALGKAAAGPFDHYACTNFDLLRGREPDEVPALLASALIGAGVPEQAITRFANEDQAVDWMLEHADPEDLVVMIYLGDGHRRVRARLEALAREQRADSQHPGGRTRVGHA